MDQREKRVAHAASDFDVDVDVDYLHPHDGSIAAMAGIIGALSPSRYAGVISTIADFEVLRAPLGDLVQRHRLPLITVNSGTQVQSEQIGALMHIGQPEFEAGRAAGALAAKAGVRSFVRLNHYANNPVARALQRLRERARHEHASGRGGARRPADTLLTTCRWRSTNTRRRRRCWRSARCPRMPRCKR